MSQTKGGNSKKRILAVDDTAVILTRISNTLRDDYDVITVNSGVRALKYLEDIPVIMLTGVEDKEIVLKSAKLGICDYILKPFSSDDLLSRICRAFDKEKQKDMES